MNSPSGIEISWWNHPSIQWLYFGEKCVNGGLDRLLGSILAYPLQPFCSCTIQGASKLERLDTDVL